ncbi:MAG: hypothetical protein AAF415_14950 [Pseudomonadota bacterium]
MRLTDMGMATLETCELGEDSAKGAVLPYARNAHQQGTCWSVFDGHGRPVPCPTVVLGGWEC